MSYRYSECPHCRSKKEGSDLWRCRDCGAVGHYYDSRDYCYNLSCPNCRSTRQAEKVAVLGR